MNMQPVGYPKMTPSLNGVHIYPKITSTSSQNGGHIYPKITSTSSLNGGHNYPKIVSTSSLNGGPADEDCVLTSTSKVMYCEKCGFVSTDSTEFNNHMKEHMGTQFICFYCNNVYYSETELQVHLEQHATKFQYKCEHCGRGYMRRQCLLKHVERLHGKASGQGLNKPDMTQITLQKPPEMNKITLQKPPDMNKITLQKPPDMTKITLNKPEMTKITHVPLSSALPRVPSTDTLSVRPTVRVTPPVRLGNDRQASKTVDINVPSVSKVDAALHELVQHNRNLNRNLTVSLPEDITIPAGCVVELVEVKTVTGTTELKLRLVSKQENGTVTKDSRTVMKDSRTTVSQNTTLGLGKQFPTLGKQLSTPLNNPKPFSTTLNNPNAMKFASMGMSTVNGTRRETTNLNVHRPAVNIAKNIPNQVSKEKGAVKRTVQETITINGDGPSVIPTKVFKSSLSPMRDGHCGIKITRVETVNLHAAPPAILPAKTQLPSMGMGVSQRAMGEKKTLIPGHPPSFPPRLISDMKRTPPPQASVKDKPRELHPKSNTPPQFVTVGQKLQSLKAAPPSVSVHLPANSPGRSSALSLSKDNVSPSFLMSHTARRTPTDSLLSRQPKVMGGSAPSDSKTSAPWSKAGRSGERGFQRVAEPESFPVISSVFSLSERSGASQGSMQPLVMALRGIVMNKANGSVAATSAAMTPPAAPTTPDCIKITNVMTEEPLKSGYCAPVATKDISFTHLPQGASEAVKIEAVDNSVPHMQTESHDVKEENESAVVTDPKAPVPDIKEEENAAPKAPALQHTHTEDPDIKDEEHAAVANGINCRQTPPAPKGQSFQHTQTENQEFKKEKNGALTKGVKCRKSRAPKAPSLKHTQTDNQDMKEEKKGTVTKGKKCRKSPAKKALSLKQTQTENLEVKAENNDAVTKGKKCRKSPAPKARSVKCKQTENDDVKGEKKATVTKGKRCRKSPALKALLSASVSTIALPTGASLTEGLLQQTPASAPSEQEVSARILTVSLKRMQGAWKQSKKQLKLRKMSNYKTGALMGHLIDGGILHTTPLKGDQLVKRPGPNQPVVVLNHPKPHLSKTAAETTTVVDPGPSQILPKCQILKMRLSKGMGHKYEVMSCTVRVFR